MPIILGQGSFSVGRDCTLVIMHPLAASGRVDIPNVTSFRSAQVTANVKSDRLDGIQLAAELPKGWTFNFMADRGSPGLDNLFALIEQSWYIAGILNPCSVYQYITEKDGSTSTFQYTQASLKFDDPGTWKGDSKVEQAFSGEAWQRLPV